MVNSISIRVANFPGKTGKNQEMLEEPEENWHLTGKFPQFDEKKDHHKMNLVEFRMTKTAILTFLKAQNFAILDNFILENVNNSSNSRLRAARIENMAVFVPVSTAKISFSGFSQEMCHTN